MGGVFRATLTGSLLALLGSGLGFGQAGSAWAAPAATASTLSRSAPSPLRRSVTLSATWVATAEPKTAPSRAGLPPATPTLSPPAPAARGAASSTPSAASSFSSPRREKPAAPTATTPGPSARPQGSPRPWSKHGPARLVWTGFKEQDGKTEILLQVTRAREPRVLGETDRVRVIIPRCRLQSRLAGKPLDTRFFPGAVNGVAAHQRGRNVVVDVRLRETVSPASAERRAGPRGSAMWVVALPSPGTPATPTEATPASKLAERGKEAPRIAAVTKHRHGGAGRR